MSIHLYVAPAAQGKTEHCLERIRESAPGGPVESVWVCVPNARQARALRQRIAAKGGALGVRVETMDNLWREILARIGRHTSLMPDAVEHRVLRRLADALVAERRIPHYEPIVARPSFVAAVRDAIQELKRARISPLDLAAAWSAEEPAQRELAVLFAAYQQWLSDSGWSDLEEMGEMAVDALGNHPRLMRDIGLLLVDGFDQFDALQIETIARIGSQVQRACITLTGESGSDKPPRMAHRRFLRAQRNLEQRLGVVAEAAPTLAPAMAPALDHLERHLFEFSASAHPFDGAITFLEATDQATEVREALRWIKRRIIDAGLDPDHLALVARDMTPYRALVREVASEFGVPIRLATREPLATCPVIAALMELLSLPWRGWPWRETIEAWRSPYLDWRCLGGMQAGDADLLAEVARWGQVVEGADQWLEALDRLSGAVPAEDSHDDPETEVLRSAPLSLEAARRLRGLWEAFVAILEPSAEDSIRGHVAWLEDLIGGEDESDAAGSESLRIVAKVLEAREPALCRRDLAALSQFKTVFGGLVLAEETVGDERPVAYRRFWDELSGVVAAATYEPGQPDQGVLVADVHDCRGLSFDSVAIIGMAEGIFPAPRREDMLLPDEVRQRLQQRFAGPSLAEESDEPTAFYEAVTRARTHLFLSRPRLADDGAPWEASPYWELALSHYADVQVLRVRSGDPIKAVAAASADEALLASARLAALPETGKARAASLREGLLHGAAIWASRRLAEAQGRFEGDLSESRDLIAAQQSAFSRWSPSGLESYARCPFAFYVGHVLGLEARQAPEEDVDAAKLGTLYHRILERVYQTAGTGADVAGLLVALDDVAPDELGSAPRRLGFRATAWWPHQQEEIRQEIANTLSALDAAAEGFSARYFEQSFGRSGQPALVIVGPGGPRDEIHLRGIIDRVDLDADGHVRVIDYKTFGSPAKFRPDDMLGGKVLQIGIYALAARDALGLGEPTAGFYWLIKSAEASRLRLEKLDMAYALNVVGEHVRRIVAGAREGRFVPKTPDDGCPPYCPAAGFCWRFAPRASYR